MTRQFKLLAVLAHPDDESLGFGGTLARYSAEGVETYLVTATRGEQGRFFSPDRKTEPAEVGRVREAELRAAAAVLGIREVSILDYPDGAVDQIDAATAIAAIVQHIRRVRPHVVVTFGPDGAYGHPDHIAISQFTTAAVVCAADADYDAGDGSTGDRSSAHRVGKLYNLAWRNTKWEAYQAAFRKLTSMVDGTARQANPWPDWAVTTEIETSAYWPVVWKAVCCHQTQMSMYEQLEQLAEAQQRELWGSQEFYRVHSAVNGGRKLETDLFEGLR
ncbi:MAG: PIG-L family deacetylase [Acidobacteriia bacterium]|nr:PIG-L family deacetylase [Terriglobia bacterium]